MRVSRLSCKQSSARARNVQAIRVHLMTNNTFLFRAARLLFVLLIFTFAFVARARAGGPVVWETNTREELLKGEAHGVSVTDTGALMLAPRFTQLFNTEQSYIWSSAVDAAGNVYLGTGHDGRIYKVAPDGKGALLYDAPELEVPGPALR